ncbi:SDR family oxidoreductase [Ideonella azotifigens]|uniref:SDR family oxidoreductase n=1 Tax=Ideonella azotifigens TaxID=513160 RepID=A0ABN1KE30_9BURK|nr:SDR family oxidoreductase [Ideonella azotifigens]MCD2344569.1 SDR family oxidoreductase [Ideonella azotifigens]
MTSAVSNFSPRAVLVIGASRGIGLELVRQYREAGAQVVATARDDAGLARLHALGAKGLRLDVTSAASVSGLAWQVDGECFDVAIVNAGVYGPQTSGLQSPTAADFDQVMHTNVLGPMQVLPQMLDALAPGARVGVLSSRMGSIGTRASSAGWLYRASKAAVNSVLADTALALKGKAFCCALHPGWVRTEMGGSGADISPEESAAGIRQVLTGLDAKRHGGFYDYSGATIPW